MDKFPRAPVGMQLVSDYNKNTWRYLLS